MITSHHLHCYCFILSYPPLRDYLQSCLIGLSASTLLSYILPSVKKLALKLKADRIAAVKFKIPYMRGAVKYLSFCVFGFCRAKQSLPGLTTLYHIFFIYAAFDGHLG